MPAFGAAIAWLQGSGLATAIRESLLLTASLSAVHLLGVTLVGGGALVSGLRFRGVLFAEQPIGEVVRPAGHAMLLGLAISVVTGGLLFSARASMAVENGFFQLKMSLLVVAAVSHALLYASGRLGRSNDWATGLMGVLRSVLYGAVIVAGCAYILFE